MEVDVRLRVSPVLRRGGFQSAVVEGYLHEKRREFVTEGERPEILEVNPGRLGQRFRIKLHAT